MKRKIQAALYVVGAIMIMAAVDTFAEGGMNTMQFILQFIAGLEAMIVSYALGGAKRWEK